jgi:hypothetical protein
MALINHDPVFWPDIPKGESLFIHKLAVKRLAAGKGLSDALITYAKSMCMDRGILELRLDCHSLIPKLRAVYERHGFDCVDEKILHGKYHTAFYVCEVHDLNHLYHYYEKNQPPFRSITALPFDEAEVILNNRREKNKNLTHPDIKWFLQRRYDTDKTIRERFVQISGKPNRDTPVYFTLGANVGVSTWYENPAFLRIPVNEIDPDTVSFTYGDVFAVFNPNLDTGEEYWGNVYRLEGMLKLIEMYGYPEDPEYNGVKGIYPIEKPLGHYLKYIEAHVWDNSILEKYRDITP